jgi:cyclophilin family peptidyl-prolyl cis-trans isomerase
VLGVALPGDSPYLTEREILELAAVIRDRRPEIVLDTTAGTMVLTVDAVRAPVHAVNLVLCALSGVYDGTPWHRVVPAFVIQGGDPRGDGSGDAGYSLPDEITPLPFVRGALGMPKGDKDTGGCQLFVMHCAAPHLDGAYTCYGEVVRGLEVIDRIRVGDRILKATVEVPTTPPAPR